MFLHTVKSFIEIVKYILQIPGVKFFLSERISQDPLENFFGCQRQRGRTGENPNAFQFCKNTQALRIINSVCGNVSKGNCRGRKQQIDMHDTKPLPKRRRIRKKAVAKENDVPSSSVQHSITVDSSQLQPVAPSAHPVHVDCPPAEPVAVGSPAVIVHSLPVNVDVDSPAGTVYSLPLNANVDSLAKTVDFLPVNDDVDSPAGTVDSLPVNVDVDSPTGTIDSCSVNVNSPGGTVDSLSVNVDPAGIVNSLPINVDVHSPTGTVDSLPINVDVDSPAGTVDLPLHPPIVFSVNFQSTLPQLQLFRRHGEQSACISAAQAIRETLETGKADEIISKGYGITLRRQDFWTLNNHRWLNDQVSFSLNICWFTY